MKTLFNTPFRKYGTAAFAALSLAALPLASFAKDKDDDDHPKGKKKEAEHTEKKHEDAKHHDDHMEKKHEGREEPRVIHKDDVVVHHKDDVIVHKKGDPVVRHDGPDHVVHHDGPVVVHRDGPVVVRRDGPDHVVHHRHPGYVLRLADGWRGHGWYYGPPTVRYFEESPDVVYYTSREEAPAEYADDAPAAAAPAESRDAAVQRALKEKGYYDGGVDGELGPMSHRAIAKYQADHDMRATGEVTERLLISLGIN